MTEAYLDLEHAADSMDAGPTRGGMMLGISLAPVAQPLPADRYYDHLREARIIDRAEAVRLLCQRLLAKAVSLSSHPRLLKFTRSIGHIAAGKCKGELLGDQAVISAAQIALSNARQLMESIAEAERPAVRTLGPVDRRDDEIAALRSRIAALEAKQAAASEEIGR